MPRFVLKGKVVVLGLLTTKQGALESQDDLLRRIDEAARYVPLDRLALRPQCGFASVAEGNRLTEDEQWQAGAGRRDRAKGLGLTAPTSGTVSLVR